MLSTTRQSSAMRLSKGSVPSPFEPNLRDFPDWKVRFASDGVFYRSSAPRLAFLGLSVIFVAPKLLLDTVRRGSLCKSLHRGRDAPEDAGPTGDRLQPAKIRHSTCQYAFQKAVIRTMFDEPCGKCSIEG
jgi:hypothetical protein